MTGSGCSLLKTLSTSQCVCMQPKLDLGGSVEMGQAPPV